MVSSGSLVRLKGLLHWWWLDSAPPRLFFTCKSLSLITRHTQSLLRTPFLFIYLSVMSRLTFLSFGRHSVPLLINKKPRRRQEPNTFVIFAVLQLPPLMVIFSKEGRRIAPSLDSSRRKCVEGVECSLGTPHQQVSTFREALIFFLTPY